MRAGRSFEEAKALQDAYKTKRVFDDPDHPQYGPVRRMWVILSQLDMLGAAEAWSRHSPLAWDAYLAAEVRSTAKESDAQRKFLGMLIGWFV